MTGAEPQIYDTSAEPQSWAEEITLCKNVWVRISHLRQCSANNINTLVKASVRNSEDASVIWWFNTIDIHPLSIVYLYYLEANSQELLLIVLNIINTSYRFKILRVFFMVAVGNALQITHSWKSSEINPSFIPFYKMHTTT